MKKININNFLMYLLIWFMIYTSALNYTYLPSAVSYIKDIIIFYFTFLLLKNKFINKPKNVGISFYILFFIIAFVSWIGLIYGTNNSQLTIIVRIFRYLEFFLLFFIFTNIEKVCTVKYEKLIKFYIILSIILLFVHIFGYFVPNNIVSIYIDNKIGNGFYRNRISIGQPPIAVYPMIISYFYLLIYKWDKTTIIKILLLLIGIIISVSTTGILSIVSITILISIPLCILDKKNLKKFLKIAICLLIIITIGILIIKSIPSLAKVYEEGKNLLRIKIGALYNDSLTDLSMEVREAKYKQIFENMENIFQKIFGLGLLGYNRNDINVGSLENTYRTMYVCYGIIGLMVFVTFIVRQIIFRLRNLKELDNIFIIALFLVFAMHSYTLEVFYLPTISYTLPLFYCYIMNNRKEKVKDENFNS